MAAPVPASFASNDAAGGSAGSMDVAAPAGIAVDDLLIVAVASDWGSTSEISLPTGFAPLATSTYDGGTNAVHIQLGQKVAVAADTTATAYTVNWTGDDEGLVGILLRATGADTTPTIAEVAANAFTANATVTSPSIPPNSADDLLVCFAAADGAGGGGGAVTWTPPPGMTLVTQRQQGNTWTALGVASLASPASPSGDETWSVGNHAKGGACTISMKAAGVVAGPNHGAATGTVAYTGAATGRRVAAGVAAGAVLFTGAAAGTAPAVPAHHGAASASSAWASAAAGHAPTVGAASGTAHGTWTVHGAATGTRPSTGAAVGGFAWETTATGTRVSAGTVTGATAWTGAASGHAPVPGRDITLTAGLEIGWAATDAAPNPLTATSPATNPASGAQPVTGAWAADAAAVNALATAAPAPNPFTAAIADSPWAVGALYIEET